MILVERRYADIMALSGCNYDPATLTDGGRDWRGVSVGKPWGWESEFYREGIISMWQLNIMAGAETSMHCHPGKRTILIVEAGYCTIETLSGSHELKPGDVAHIEPGAFHRTKTRAGAVLIEVESPPNKADIVRLQDRYGREGQAYELCASQIGS